MTNQAEPVDPDEICLHCGSLIDSNYRICPFCGRVWYVREENTNGTQERLYEGCGELPRREP